MKKLVSTLNLDKKEWLQYRKKGIGGSDAGAVCGLNPYRTAMQVYQDKISEETEEIDNEAMRQGREFEDYVARRFTEATESKNRIAFQNSMKIQCHSAGISNLKKTCVKRLEEIKIFRILKSKQYYLKCYLREKLTSCGFFT